MGGAIWPALTGVVTLAAFAWFWRAVPGVASGRRGEGWLFLLTGATAASVLLTTAWPGLLPPGGGADITHHLMLVDELARTRHLVVDPAAGLRLAEMAHYTPGLHLLVVTVAELLGREAWRLLYPLVLASVALKAGWLALIARRVVGGVAGASALAVTAVALVPLVPRAYSVGGFLEAGFLAQVASESAMVAGWWALMAWSVAPTRVGAALVGFAAAATFLIWPIYVGPLALATAVTWWRQTRERRGGWWPQLAWMAAPTAVVAAMHLWWHWAWLGMAGANGAVPAFLPDAALVVLVALAIAGAVARRDGPPMRVVLTVAAAIALQALALWVLATMRGAASPYMAAKMIYLAAYPLAILAAAGLARVVGAIPRAWHTAGAWASLASAVAVSGRLVSSVTVPAPLVSIDLHEAGVWARDTIAPQCVEYVVANRDVAYWLHLAVMGNPRSSERTAALDAYLANAAVGRWIEGTSLPYAIADRRLLPSGLGANVAPIYTIGEATVLARPRRSGDPACIPLR
jgi:hypothetical protein